MSKLNWIILWVSTIFILVGIVWSIYLHFSNWDVLLTSKQKFFMYWKPTTMVILGAAVLKGFFGK